MVFSLLTFVPSRYLYPSQSGQINAVSNVLGAAWACLIVVDLAAIAGRDAIPAPMVATWNLAICLALLSRLLHDRFVGDHAQTLAS